MYCKIKVHPYIGGFWEGFPSLLPLRIGGPRIGGDMTYMSIIIKKLGIQNM